MFYVEYDTPWKLFELVPFVFLGVLGVSEDMIITTAQGCR